MSARLSRLRAMLRRWCRGTSASERALDEEIASVLEHEIGARIADGMSPADAQRTARAAFGGAEPVKEHIREARTGALVESVVRDTRYAWRSIWRSPGSSLAVVGSLAIGLAVTIAAMAFVNALMFGDYPGVADQRRLIEVGLSRTAGENSPDVVMRSEADYLALRDGLDGLQGLTAFSGAVVTAALPEPHSLAARLVSANYFEVFGTRARLGRTFTPDEDRPTRAAVAVISYRSWRRDFNGDPSAIGRAIRVADAYVTVVGVAPDGFGGTTPGLVDIWMPMAMSALLARDSTWMSSPERRMTFVGRLKDDVSAVQIRAAAEAIATQRLAAEGLSGQHVKAATFDISLVDPSLRARAAWLVTPIPVLVLVIACVNASVLLLARGTRRAHELAVRLAIGASRGRVVRQLVIESLALGLLAAGVGILLASWGLRVASLQFFWLSMAIDASVLAERCS